MKRTRKILSQLVAIALVAVWFQTCAHADACHGEDDAGGDPAAESVCACECHGVLVADRKQDLDVPMDAGQEFPDFLTLRGTSVPADIFRPPLVNS